MHTLKYEWVARVGEIIDAIGKGKPVILNGPIDAEMVAGIINFLSTTPHPHQPTEHDADICRWCGEAEKAQTHQQPAVTKPVTTSLLMLEDAVASVTIDKDPTGETVVIDGPADIGNPIMDQTMSAEHITHNDLTKQQ